MSFAFIKTEIEKIEELAYRKGVAHGLHTGLRIPEDPNELHQKIEQWRHDLNNKMGASGSQFEDQQIYYGKD